jgi:hypothetical protein
VLNHQVVNAKQTKNAGQRHGLKGKHAGLTERDKRNLCNQRAFVPSFMLTVRAQGGRKSRLKALRICFWRGADPRKARLFAEQKMRPNELRKTFHTG